MKKILNKSVIILSLVLIFLIGIYIGNGTSYSISTEEQVMSTGNDNVLLLNSISFESKEAKAADKVYISIDSTGSILNGATIHLIRTDGKYTIDLNVKDIDTKPYVEIPKYVNTGEYIIKSLLLVGINSNEETFSKNFTTSPNGTNDSYFKFDASIKLESVSKNVEIDLIKSFSLDRTTFNGGDNVKLKIDYDKDIRVVRLNFITENGTFYSYINSMARNPYIIIPTSAKLGSYTLDNIYVETYNYGSVVYKNIQDGESKYLDYISTYNLLQENDMNSANVYFNNIDLDNDIINQIRNSESIKNIYLYTTDSPTVSEDLFTSIKGTDKKLFIYYKDLEYVFDGTDIKNNKMFDSTADYKLVSNTKLKDLVTDGLVITFASNGELPGNCKVILNKNGLLEKAFTNDVINIYYVKDDKSFEIIKEGLELKDNQYQFDITHTSSYLLTNSKIDKIHIVDSESTEEDSSNTKTNSKKEKPDIIKILIIVIAILLVITVILLIKVSTSNKKEEPPKKEKEEETPVEEQTEELSEEDIIENIAAANEKSIDDDE